MVLPNIFFFLNEAFKLFILGSVIIFVFLQRKLNFYIVVMNNISCLIRTKNHEKLIKQLYGDDLTEEQLAAYFVRHEAVADMVATIMSKKDITGSAIVSLPTVISILDGSSSLDEVAQKIPERAEAFKKAFIERYRSAMNAAGNEGFFSSMTIKHECIIISFFPDVAVNIEDYGSIETAKQALRIYTGAYVNC